MGYSISRYLTCNKMEQVMLLIDYGLNDVILLFELIFDAWIESEEQWMMTSVA